MQLLVSNDYIDQYFGSKDTEVLKFFQSLPMMEGWPIWNLSEIVKEASCLELEKRQTVFKAGDPVDDIYFIKEGEVELSKEVEFKYPEDIGSFSSSPEFRRDWNERTRISSLSKIWKEKQTKKQKLPVTTSSFTSDLTTAPDRHLGREAMSWRS